MTAVATCQHLRRTSPPPNGPTLAGTCVDCGDVRSYPASIDDAPSINERALEAAHAARRKSPRFNTALSPASKPMTVYTRHEAPARERAAKPAKPPKAEKQTKEKKPRAPRVRPVRVCVDCGGPAAVQTKPRTPRCRACYEKSIAAQPRLCACGAQLSIRAAVCAACAKRLTPDQEAIVAYVREHGTANSREISGALGIDPLSLSKRLQKLVVRGELSRGRHEKNPTWFTYWIARDAAAPGNPPDARGVLHTSTA